MIFWVESGLNLPNATQIYNSLQIPLCNHYSGAMGPGLF